MTITPEQLAEKAAAAKAAQGVNPANKAGSEAQVKRARIPMSLPTLKTEVPDLPGYHLHWMSGTPQRLAQAQRAGYEFVQMEEIQLANVPLGGDALDQGSTDMGGRVSIVAGGVGEDGQASRLYLMKLKEEFWLEDQSRLQARNDSIADALTAGLTGAGAQGESADDVQRRYVDRSRTVIPDLFKRKTR